MPYAKDFFALKLSCAHKLAKRFRRNLDDILFNYTTFSRSINLTAERPFDQSNPVWKTYIKGLRKLEGKRVVLPVLCFGMDFIRG